MNIATISPISIQLKLINEHDAIFQPMVINWSLKLKVFTLSLEYKNVLLGNGIGRRQTDRQAGSSAGKHQEL